MIDIEQDRFNGNVRILSATLLWLCEAKGIAPNDTANVVTGALAEVLANCIGPVETVERLRTIADLIEHQILCDGLQSVQ